MLRVAGYTPLYHQAVIRLGWFAILEPEAAILITFGDIIRHAENH
jgi:hypothetical protein